MPFDFKKEYKELYLPGKTPMLIEVPEMTFIQVSGMGDPNTSQSYQTAVELLYGLSYAIKMSKNGDSRPMGYFDYVVPPLEGLWDVDDPSFIGGGMAIKNKNKLRWVSMIRQPDFVTPEVFAWAKDAVAKKKPGLDVSLARIERFAEGLCAQVMHNGPYDDEPATIMALDKFISESGFKTDITPKRHHHEIYLSDPRKTAPDKMKTVIRHPVAAKRANHSNQENTV